MFKVGQKVKIKDNIPFYLKEEYIGNIITLKKRQPNTCWWLCEENGHGWNEKEIELLGCPNSGIIIKEDLV